MIDKPPYIYVVYIQNNIILFVCDLDNDANLTKINFQLCITQLYKI